MGRLGESMSGIGGGAGASFWPVSDDWERFKWCDVLSREIAEVIVPWRRREPARGTGGDAAAVLRRVLLVPAAMRFNLAIGGSCSLWTFTWRVPGTFRKSCCCRGLGT